MICTGAISRTETQKLLVDVGWTSLKKRPTKFKLIYIFIKFMLMLTLFTSMQIFMPFCLTGDSSKCKVGMINIPFCRTSKFKNSFFPSTISIWNKLITGIRLYDSLNKLKKFLATKFEIDNRYFNYNLMNGPTDIIVTQMRLGLSSLRDHLFQGALYARPKKKICCFGFCRGAVPILNMLNIRA